MTFSYPQNTLSPALLPFVQRCRDVAVRRSSNGDDLVLVISTFFSKTTTLRFPVALLDAQESEITRWARDQYWSAIRDKKLRARQSAREERDKTQHALDKAQRDFDAAQQRLANVSAPSTKTQQRL